jgi:hypothetical protein
MEYGPQNSPLRGRGLLCVLLLALIVLLPHRQIESVSGLSSTFLIAQAKLRIVAPVEKLPFEIAFLLERTDQTPQINPSVLRVDLKQNLLVWPNIASDQTRSPPIAV